MTLAWEIVVILIATNAATLLWARRQIQRHKRRAQSALDAARARDEWFEHRQAYRGGRG